MDEIQSFLNDDSVKGEIARELNGILSDYESGTLTLEEKNELVESVVQTFKNSNNASDEVTLRWVVLVANVAGSII